MGTYGREGRMGMQTGRNAGRQGKMRLGRAKRVDDKENKGKSMSLGKNAEGDLCRDL